MPEQEPNGMPAATDTAGQQPTNNGTNVNPASDPIAQGQNPPAADGMQGDGQQAQAPDVQNPAAQKAAQEAARYRTELREAQRQIAEFQAEKQAAEDAKLTETERLQKQVADFQAKEAQQTLEWQERLVRAEVKAAASALGLNPALAARIVDYAAIEYDERGDPTNVPTLLQAAIKDYGLSVTPAASTPQQSDAPANTTPLDPNAALAARLGATNPTRQTGPVPVTANQYMDKAFQADFKNRYGISIQDAVLRGKATLV